MAEAYNWARMSDKVGSLPDNKNMRPADVARLKHLYRSIWTAVLGDDKGFEEFFEECKTGKVTLLVPLKDEKGNVVKDEKGRTVIATALDDQGKLISRNGERVLATKEMKVNGTVFMTKLQQEYERRNPESAFTSKVFYDKIKAARPELVTAEVDGNGKPITAKDKNGQPILDAKMRRAMMMVATQFKHVGISNQDTHIAAGFLSGLGYHTQQGCGQGKSSAVATATLMERGMDDVVDKQLFITSSTRELASQSFGDIAAYFDDLGIGQQEGQVGEPERVFLMTDEGPRVAVRTTDGRMLSKNDVQRENLETLNDPAFEHKDVEGFDETASCETEAVHFVVEANGSVRLAKRDPNKVIEYEDKNVEFVAGKDKEGNKIKKTLESVKRKRLGWEEGSVTFDQLSAAQQKQALAAIYGDEKNIIIADNATIVQDNMRGAIPGATNSNVPRHVIMDEGDYVKNDQFHYLQQKGEAYEDAEQEYRTGKAKLDKDGNFAGWEKKGLRAIARDVVVALKARGEKKFESYIQKDTQTQFAQLSDAGIDAIITHCRANKIELTNEMMQFIEEAFVVEAVFVEDIDYVVENGKVISQERASGSEMDLPEGIAQALAIKHGLVPAKEHRVYNIQTIMGAYDKIFGEKGQTRLSGTHESETLGTAITVANLKVAGEPNREAITEAASKGEYGQAVNAYFQNTRYRSMLKDQTQVDQAILAETKVVLESGRPVLIGCVSSHDVKEMKDQLRNQHGGNEQEAGAVEKWGEVTVITYTAETSKSYSTDRNGLSAKAFKSKYGKSKKEFTAETPNPTAEQKYDLEGLEDGEFKTKYKVEKDKAPKTFDKFVKTYGGQEKTIVLGTSIIGRGANIGIDGKEKLSDDKTMNERGGLHVITRGLHPSSVRQMVQFINRSMRGSDNGSSHEFFSYEEVKKAKPQIAATIDQIKKQLNQINTPESDPEKEAKRQVKHAKLTEELKEYESALALIEKAESAEKSNVTGATFTDGAKGIYDLLENGNATIQVDNDGRHVPRDKDSQENNNAAKSIAEALYRGFYGAADKRNENLAIKARTIEGLVVGAIEALKTTIASFTNCEDKLKVQIARDLVPEFIGRALQIQYKANGHTKDEITQQCESQINLLAEIYDSRARQQAGQKEYENFDEAKFLSDKAKTGDKTARRMYVLSDREREGMHKDYGIVGEVAAEQVQKESEMTAQIRALSDEEIKAAYAELNGAEAVAKIEAEGKTLKASDLLAAIKEGKVQYSQVIQTINQIKTPGKEQSSTKEQFGG